MQESLEASLVRIYAVDGRVVGAGFLVGERHILTCAHVISQALDLADSPVDPPQGIVSLDFPRIPPRMLLTARVVLWCPPILDGSGDIAGLELEHEPPPGAEDVRFASAENVWNHDFGVFGFPEGYDDGVWATGRLLRRQATNWIQIEGVKAQGFAVGPGFSGTPVWDEQLQGVVGMVVAASRPADTRTAFVIPLDVLASVWPLLTVPPDQPRNPYKGLRPFTQRDAADFFGREVVVKKVLDLINSLVTEQPARSSTRLLTILGPSGVGKSSLIMAGLLPKLQQGALPGSKDWVYLYPMVPGKYPLEALASTLKPYFPDTSFKTLREDLEDETARGLHLLATQLAKQRGTSVVLLIDQCEELFTQTESEDERQRFIRLLLNACSEPRGPAMVVLTLRADFYDRPMQYPELFRLIEAQHLSLLAIEPEDLRRVVEQPAALSDVQVTFEGDLVNRILFEVQSQVGALPLLQFTLDRLFQQRSGRQLTLSAYHKLGGVKGALVRKAEETYTALPSEGHRILARALFVRLIDPGATEQDTTRRRAALSEFSLPEANQTRLLQEVADAFIATRLLTTNEIGGTTTIEVSHEALIREWPRLASWLRKARDDIPLQQAISKDAAKWEQLNKPGDRLYRGSQLKEAQAWAKRNTPSGDEVAFLHAGAAQRMRSIASVTVIVLLLLSMTGLAGWFLSHPSPDPARVMNLQDNGRPVSLRYAVNEALSGSTITFDASLHGTILLTNGDLDIARNLKILGPGVQTLSISSGTSGHVIHVFKGYSVTISGLAFKDSRLSLRGLILNEGTLTLVNSIVSGNSANGVPVHGCCIGGDGAGIYNSGTLTLAHSIVSDNFAEQDGGGIYNAGTLMLIDSAVSGNGAEDGGGIFNFGTPHAPQYDQKESMLALTNSMVSGNIATEGGGIYNLGMLTLANSTVSGNNGGNGGGIYNGGMLTLIDSTVSDNTAKDGGGGIAIFEDISSSQYPPSVLLLYCTVYGNAANVGGGIWTGNIKQGYIMTIGASIVAGNHANSGRDIAGRLITLGYNLVGDRSGTVLHLSNLLDLPENQPTDILGVSSTALKIDSMLRDNGGSAQTHTRTHALLLGSPAIDVIPLQYCRKFIEDIFYGLSRIYTDQRGMKRPDENESACDIGAYEYVDSPT